MSTFRDRARSKLIPNCMLMYGSYRQRLIKLWAGLFLEFVSLFVQILTPPNRNIYFLKLRKSSFNRLIGVGVGQ